LKTLTQKEAAALIGVTVRTFQRYRVVYGIREFGFTGQVPLFTFAALKKLEKKRSAAMADLAKRRFTK